MSLRGSVALVLTTILIFTPAKLFAQFPINPSLVSIIEVLDPDGMRLGTIVVAGRSGRGYEEGQEYWRFSEEALLEIADQEGLELAMLAEGEWEDPWVVEALGWQPDGPSVGWSHPAEVEWTPQDESRPPVVPGGTYFGNATLGGLTIQYSSRGPSSLTWFKLTDGAFMQFEDGAVFKRDADAPTTGSWWHGPVT